MGRIFAFLLGKSLGILDHFLSETLQKGFGSTLLLTTLLTLNQEKHKCHKIGITGNVQCAKEEFSIPEMLDQGNGI